MSHKGRRKALAGEACRHSGLRERGQTSLVFGRSRRAYDLLCLTRDPATSRLKKKLRKGHNIQRLETCLQADEVKPGRVTEPDSSAHL